MTRQIALAHAAQSMQMGQSGMVAEIAESIVSLASDRPILVISGRENLGLRAQPAGLQLLRLAPTPLAQPASASMAATPASSAKPSFTTVAATDAPSDSAVLATSAALP